MIMMIIKGGKTKQKKKKNKEELFPVKVHQFKFFQQKYFKFQETLRSKRIQSLYSTIRRSKTGETTLLKPLTITGKLELLEVESDDEEFAL